VRVTGADRAGQALLWSIGSLLCRVVPASFFAYKCVAFFADFLHTGRWTSLAWILSEGLVVVLFVVRRSSHSVSRRPADWAAAIGGTLVFMLASPSSGGLIPQPLGLALQLAGLGVQLGAKLSLGRSFGAVPANRGVVVHGAYRLVRHPMYTGYLVSHVGFLLTNLSPWNLAVYVLGYTLQFARIRAEESFLRRDADYARYCTEVRYRLIPGVF
jgi:protein-S-isoprenylcysteine O-methyltransferase Ste14